MTKMIRAVFITGAVSLIWIYRNTISLLIGPCCRYLPTCSQYGELTIRHFGLWPGGWMTLARIARCHPWGGCGYDPPPTKLPADYHWYLPWRCGTWGVD